MITNASVTDLKAAMARGAKIIDVREKHEFDSGHVPTAEHIPMSIVPLRADEFKAATAEEPVWLICESGNRSYQVCDYLVRHGYNAVNVNGGTAAWRALGLPINK